MRRVAALAASAAMLAAACSGSGGRSSHQLTVLAAASLSDAFDVIETQFENVHPGTTVRVAYGPSDGLARQIQAGDPADVFASASETWMDAVRKRPGVSDQANFARNRMVIVVPSTNPAHVRSIHDLAKPGLKLVLAAPGVPAGDYARAILRKAGIAHAALANVVSNEVDVRGVLAKLDTGDADAGIVYTTDARRAGTGIIPISIPPKLNVVATYPIAVVRGSSAEGTARAFVRFVLGPGQATLRAAGFMPA